ncbi:MAG: glycosyltransferase [Saprospiraceae bacterium]|nr:glycosyltransferase [Saprospiraceae bacterium]
MVSKLLSITIPTYNRASFLKETLKQLFFQFDEIDINQIEIIVSDNCSTDNTSEVIFEFVKKGFQINYIRNEKI